MPGHTMVAGDDARTHHSRSTRPTAPRLDALFTALERSSVLEDDRALAGLLSGLRTSNGAWKTTRPGRHATANRFLGDWLAATSHAVRGVADIGVSSGVTTAEFLDDLAAWGHSPGDVVAVDRSFDAVVVRLAPHFHVVTDSEGYLLRMEYRGLNCTPWCSLRDWATGLAVIKHALHRRAQAGLRALPMSGPEAHQQRRRLQLVSPSLRRRPGVTLVEHDLLTPLASVWHGRADLIRVANVLNTELMAPAKLQQMARHISALGHEGTVLYACRSTMRSVRGSLFVMEDQRLRLAASLGGGVDAEAILDGLPMGTAR